MDHARVALALGLLAVEALLLVTMLSGCGARPTTTTLYAPTTGTAMPSPSGTGSTGTTGTQIPGTTSVSPGGAGTTAPGPGNGGAPALRSLTFVGPLTPGLLERVQTIVAAAGWDGQKVLDAVGQLAAGDPVPVSDALIDSVIGVGFAAGAGTSQPVAVAQVPDGPQVFLAAYTVSERPDQTTIVAFETATGAFFSKVGPLDIGPTTPNITTTTQ
jgi:hypothetical protein